MRAMLAAVTLLFVWVSTPVLAESQVHIGNINVLKIMDWSYQAQDSGILEGIELEELDVKGLIFNIKIKNISPKGINLIGSDLIVTDKLGKGITFFPIEPRELYLKPGEARSISAVTFYNDHNHWAKRIFTVKKEDIEIIIGTYEVLFSDGSTLKAKRLDLKQYE